MLVQHLRVIEGRRANSLIPSMFLHYVQFYIEFHLQSHITFSLNINTFISFSKESIRAGSQCFHVKGVPTLKLKCPAGELIRIHTAFYGTKMRDPSEGAKNLLDMQTVCAYESGQDHCIQLTDMHENCMGR